MGKRSTNKKERRIPEHVRVIAGAVVVVIIAGTGPPWWWDYFRSSPPNNSAIVGFSGGCATHQIFAEKRGSNGTVIRAGPNPMATQIARLPANMSIAVNGWAYGKAAPKTEGVSLPDRMIWFHLADDSGWVSFTTVHVYPTGYDPTGEDPPQVHVVASAACEGSATS
jgi:hypothetical protein